MIGRTIGGKYTVVRRLGEGGMGAVFEARHTGTGRRVAVKVITGEMAQDAHLVTRFEQEARAAGAVESEHIVQVLDVGRDEATGEPFLVMEFLVGEDVQQLLLRLGPVPADLVLRIGVQACLGLERAHAAGIVHRDIKPANLFLTERQGGERLLKLLDFGIAKVDTGELGPTQRRRPLTRTGMLLGSPLYMSPEQSRSKGALDHRTDLWSLGIVLYQALSGQTPFEQVESVGDFILAVCTVPVAPIKSVAPWVDEAVARAVEHALAIEPEKRYQSAAAMREALAAFLPEGAEIRASMLVRAPEAGEPEEEPVPSTQPATPFVLPPEPEPKPLAAVAAAPSVELLPAGPPPGSAAARPLWGPPPSVSATIPGTPVPEALTPEPPLPEPAPSPRDPSAPVLPPAASPTPSFAQLPAPPSEHPAPPPPAARRRSRSGLAAALVGTLLLAGTGGLAGAYALGWIGGEEPAPIVHVEPSVKQEVPVHPTHVALSALSGLWWSEAGVAYNGVVNGGTVELRVHDPEQLPGLGYGTGEPAFVLRPIAAEPSAFRVEVRLRPPPPRGTVYDHARAAASCVARVSEVGGKPLKAVEAIDRLVVQTAKLEPTPGMFVHEGFRVLACNGLAEARAIETEVILGRTPVASPAPRWTVPVDAGAHDAGAHDAGAHDGGAHEAGLGVVGAACQSDGQCATDNCYNHRCLPIGKGYGAPCSNDAQCGSHRCVATACR